MPAAEEVDVEVGHGFPAVRAVVDDDAVAVFRESELCRQLRGGEKQVAEGRLVVGCGFADAGNVLGGNDEDVGGETFDRGPK